MSNLYRLTWVVRFLWVYVPSHPPTLGRYTSRLSLYLHKGVEDVTLPHSEEVFLHSDHFPKKQKSFTIFITNYGTLLLPHSMLLKNIII